MKVLSVVGARPQFIKLAPLAHMMDSRPEEFRHSIVHTGQHYDPSLSAAFFDGLRIPAPVADLGVGSGSHGVQTGRIMEQLDAVLLREQPDVVLVYGDTNSTLAGAICATKLHFPVAHLEAGLRSGNRRMPEEINRIVVDHAADLLLAPTKVGMSNLAAEGLASRGVLVGDVMADLCLSTARELRAEADGVAKESAPYIVCTLHRAENTDDPARLAAIVASIARLHHRVLLVAHPRLVQKARDAGVLLAQDGIEILDPLDYRAMLQLMMGSVGLVTDSGGLQKEAFFLGVLCTTVRGETEWSETIDSGWNQLATDPDALIEAARRSPPVTEPDIEPYGGGQATARVCQALRDFDS